MDHRHGIKIALPVVLLLLVSGVPGQSGIVFSPEEVVRQANSAYESGDYAAAIDLYETVVENGAVDSVVYFNLGSAYYETGDLGHALLNYRRAQDIIPRDADVDVRLAQVRGERIDIQGDETVLTDSLSALTAGVLTLSELAWLVLILWASWFGILFAYVLRLDWREVLRVPLLTVGILLIIGVVLLGSRLYVTIHRPAAVVMMDSVQVMSGPGDDYLKHFELHAAAEVRLIESRGGWVRFVLPDGRQGWIPQEAVEKV